MLGSGIGAHATRSRPGSYGGRVAYRTAAATLHERQLLLHAEEHRPDVTLLDLRMPQLDGVGAIEQIRQLDPAARAILLTTFAGEEDIYRGIRAGSKAYLLNDAPRDEILTCIRRVHSGDTFVPAALAAKRVERISGAALT